MMCQRIGRLPIGAIGLGMTSLTSRKRVPRPPHKIATFIVSDGESECCLLLVQLGTVKLEVGWRADQTGTVSNRMSVAPPGFTCAILLNIPRKTPAPYRIFVNASNGNARRPLMKLVRAITASVCTNTAAK